ncbi:MAG: hypothetical protein A2269_02090 [Lentisphaerae bacterium RIFOXYA12_FULL_60_10]|nr:MAG: hypothetical protein A2269_02090 [Lentisphaerae bacterium RIFOXYA12_FULL_60_10]
MAMPQPDSTHKTDTVTRKELNPICQVVLFNDDVNSMEYVVLCLMQVFGHNLSIAAKIMYEAHHRGRAIAEVEDESPANHHLNQLHTHGLNACVERI